jgi:hypothetical protein
MLDWPGRIECAGKTRTGIAVRLCIYAAYIRPNQMKKMIIIVEKDRGIFLGSYDGIALFTNYDVFCNTNAYAFQSKEKAEEFIEKGMPKIKNTVKYLEIPSDGAMYVSMVEIIKAGYPEHVKDMFLNMQTEPTLH